METFKPFDVANYLKTEEDIAGYLAAVAEEGDPAAMVLALGDAARIRNVAALARQIGISRESVYKAFAPGGNPSFSTVAKMASAMGFRVVFQPIAAEPEPAPAAADA